MSHRIDIELTSQTDAGWTWRAAGARQPKGLLDPHLVYQGARVGDVVRAEADRGLDGTRIVSLTPPKGRKQEVDRIEIIERAHSGPQVSVTYAEKGGPRRDRDGGGRDGARGPRPDRPDRPRADRPAGDRGARPPRGDRPERGPRPERSERPARPERAGAPARPKRLSPSRVHRDAMMAELSPEQQPIAEQLFRGGIPAVRQAIIDQNAQLKASGQAEIPAAPLLAMAEDLVPRTRQAEWLDKAAAALEARDSISLRDLRSVVTQADGVSKDDTARDTSAKLRALLTERIEGERTAWVNDITASLDDSKLVRAVRLSGRIPDPGAKLPPEIVTRLVAETNAGLSSDTPSERWAALIEAAADAPFRRDVVPAGLPTAPSESLLATAAQASNRIPALLKLLGLTIPPPPKAKAAGRPVPPPPPIPTPAAPVAAVPAPDSPVAQTPVVETPVVETPAASAAAPAPIEPTLADATVAPAQAATPDEPVSGSTPLSAEAPPAEA